MKRKILLAGNWKMHKTNEELAGFFTAFPAGSDQVEVLFGVPFTLLARARELTAAGGIIIAAQNVHWEASGAFTGEVSVPMLKDIGIGAAIVGHSERRQYFGDTDETVAKRAAACLAGGITPIVCIGETLADREAGRTDKVLESQMQAVFAAIQDPGDMVIAYEPVWAIGTGLTATNEQAQAAHRHVRGLFAGAYGEQAAGAVRILYGGSAKPGNIGGLLDQEDIDGGLVGGASLKAEDFGAMLKAAEGKA